jgi:hypothetical protein
MSWVNDLFGSFGNSGAAVTVALRIYSGCVAAEKVADKDAVSAISRMLKCTSFEDEADVASTANLLFLWTFGNRYLSWKCIRRSILLSTIFLMALLILFYAKTEVVVRSGFAAAKQNLGDYGEDPIAVNLSVTIGLFGYFIIQTLIPDYVALLKTRLLLRYSSKLFKLMTPLSDIFLSIAFNTIIVEIAAYFTPVFRLTLDGFLREL